MTSSGDIDINADDADQLRVPDADQVRASGADQLRTPDAGQARTSDVNLPSPADFRFMRQALAQADIAAQLGEVPIGAVVVHDGEIIARSHNRRELDHDPSGHAEFQAMLAAARALDRWRLSGCTVYVTCEPCLMCAGLMVNARVDRCVFGAPDPKGGALGTLYDVSHDARLNHEFQVTAGVLEQECAQRLTSFFAELRARRRLERDARRAASELPTS